MCSPYQVESILCCSSWFLKGVQGSQNLSKMHEEVEGKKLD